MKKNFYLFPSTKGDVALFDDFFASEMDETISPFLTPGSRILSRNLSFRASLIATFFWILSFLLSFLPLNPNWSHLCLLFTFFFAGTDALIGALEDLFTFTINIDILMTLSAFLSLLIGSGQEGALLLVLFAFSGALEDRVRSRANKSIRALTQLAPTKAYVQEEEGRLAIHSVKAIKPGQKLYIPAGEVIPLDGFIITGQSSLNLVHLTGENLPKSVREGDEVPAGASNLEGPLTIEVTTTSSDSTIARIIQMVMEAHQMRPKFQRFIDRFSSRYAQGVILFALSVALVGPYIFQITYQESIYRAIAVLIAASPCALVIAIPITYLSALSALAKKGILIKGGTILDALSECRIFAFDKTGTLTKGELHLSDITLLSEKGEINKGKLLAYALEQGALHPIGRAILAAAQKEDLPLLSLDNHRVLPGFGIEATYQQQEIFIGNSALILPKLPPHERSLVEAKLNEYNESGQITTLLYSGQELYLFRFNDDLRPSIQETLRYLKKECKAKVLMLTGDHKASAKRVADLLELDHYYYELRPEDKLAHIDALAKTQTLAMVGDGINDAPSLARATVGISMGQQGARAAIDASDVILLQDHVEMIRDLMAKAKKAVKIVRQNITFALFAIFVASAAAFLGKIPLWLAVVIHEGGTVLVALNALRLLTDEKRKF